MTDVLIDGYPCEYAVEVPGLYFGDSEPRVHIGINKLGGGTLGVLYPGTWEWIVYANGEPVLEEADLRSGAQGATHDEMARSLCSFLSAAGESLYGRDGDSEYAGEYTDEQTAFLVAEYERLSMFSVTRNVTSPDRFHRGAAYRSRHWWCPSCDRRS